MRHWVMTVVVALGVVCGCGSDPMKEGWRQFRDGELDVARATFLPLTRDAQRRAEAEYALGEIDLASEKYSDAANRFERAYQSRPSFAMAAAAQGEALLMLGRKEEAYAAFLTALEATDSSTDHVPRIAGLVGDAYHTTRLTRVQLDNYSPHFHPNGAKLLYTTHFDGSANLAELTLSTLESTPLTDARLTNEYAGRYSPDGKTVLYSAVQNRTMAALITHQGSGSGVRNELFFTRDLATGADTPLMESSGNVANPTFSPDGKKIAYEAVTADEENLDVWMMDADGKNPTRLTTNPEDDGYPEFSSDGKFLVFLRTLAENVDLMRLDLSDMSVRQITHTPRDELSGVFSPDGKRFVYSRFTVGDNVTLVSRDWQTGIVTTLSTSYGRNIQPHVSPDGTQIVFVSDRNDYLELFLMDLNRPVQPDTLKRQIHAIIARSSR
ncbi:MAG: hypothetical protein O3A46_03115 [Candidatus Poribacteria bacterium]|nr:hypothetical protein [Candidatus Poribacteria bacterium]